MFGLKFLSTQDPRAMGQLELSGAMDGGDLGHAGIASGMAAGTRVATTMGWRPVEGIILGDMVLTFDGGLQKVVSVQRGRLWTLPANCPRHFWPLRVTAGALGNKAETILLPEQAVMIEADCAEDILGDPFALIPAAALEGMKGVELISRPHEMDVITLQFAEDQVVFANMGVLFFCPARRGAAGLSDMLDDAVETAYVPLPIERAEALVALIEVDARDSCPAFWGAMSDTMSEVEVSDR